MKTFYIRCLSALFCCLALGATASADGLRVDDASQVQFMVADISPVARALGIDEAQLIDVVVQELLDAGLEGTHTAVGLERPVLFIDVDVREEAYLVSLDFWREVQVPQPGGSATNEHVPVWQAYTIGAHDDDAASIRASFVTVLQRFVTRYRDANALKSPQQVAATR